MVSVGPALWQLFGIVTHLEHSLTIVIRSAGERTEDLCRTALREQTDAVIETVVERPFLRALRGSVRLGIEAQRDWTLCVDADVILAPDAIQRLIRHMKLGTDVFFACGFLLDRFYGEPKARGVHLYRTEFLEEAERAIPESVRNDRPETAMKQVLLERGRRSLYIEGRPLGIHGYGQYYRDIFRTIATRGQKSREQFAPLMERFSGAARRDLDLRVALWALVAGTDGEFSLDARHWDTRIDVLLDASGISEKSELSARESRDLRMLARLAGLVPLALWRRFRRIKEMVRRSTA